MDSPDAEKLPPTSSSGTKVAGSLAWWVGRIRGLVRGALPVQLSLFLRRVLHSLHLWLGPDQSEAGSEGGYGGVKKSPSTTKLGSTGSIRRRLLRMNLLPLLWVACVLIMLFVQMFSPSIVPSIRRSKPARDLREGMGAKVEEAAQKARKVKEASSKKKHIKEEGHRDGKEKGKEKERGKKRGKDKGNEKDPGRRAGGQPGPNRSGTSKNAGGQAKHGSSAPGRDQAGKGRDTGKQAKHASGGSHMEAAGQAVGLSIKVQQRNAKRLSRESESGERSGTKAVQGRAERAPAAGKPKDKGAKGVTAAGQSKGGRVGQGRSQGVTAGSSKKSPHPLLKQRSGRAAGGRVKGATGGTRVSAGRTKGTAKATSRAAGVTSRAARGTKAGAGGARVSARTKSVKARALAKTPWRPIPGSRFVRTSEATSFRKALYCVSTHGHWLFDPRPRPLPWPISRTALGQCERRLQRSNRAKLAYWRADRVAAELQGSTDQDDPGAWSRWDVRPSLKWTWQVDPAMCHVQEDELKDLRKGQLPEVRRDSVCRLLLGAESGGGGAGMGEAHRVILVVGDSVQDDFAMSIVASMLVGIDGRDKEEAVRFIRTQALPCDWPRLRHKRVCWGAELCGGTGLGSLYLIFVRNDIASLVRKPRWDPSPAGEGPEFQVPWLSLLPQLHRFAVHDFISAAEFTGAKNGLAHLRYTAPDDTQASADAKHEDGPVAGNEDDSLAPQRSNDEEGRAVEGTHLGSVPADVAEDGKGDAATSAADVTALNRAGEFGGEEHRVGATSMPGSVATSASKSVATSAPGSVALAASKSVAMSTAESIGMSASKYVATSAPGSTATSASKSIPTSPPGSVASSSPGSVATSAGTVRMNEKGGWGDSVGGLKVSSFGQLARALVGGAMAKGGGEGVQSPSTDGTRNHTGEGANGVSVAAGATGSSSSNKVGANSATSTAGAAAGGTGTTTGSTGSAAGSTTATAGAKAGTTSVAVGTANVAAGIPFATAGSTGASTGNMSSSTKAGVSSTASTAAGASAGTGITSTSSAGTGAATGSSSSQTASVKAGTATSAGSASKAGADISSGGSGRSSVRTGASKLLFQWATGVVDPRRGTAITSTVKRRRTLLAAEGGSAHKGSAASDFSRKQILEVAKEGRVHAAGAHGDVSSHVSTRGVLQGADSGSKVRHLAPVVILNRGLHFVQDDTFWPQLNNTLRYARSLCPGCLLVFRNSAGPHSNCTRAKRPFRKRTQLTLAASEAVEIANQSRSLALRRLVQTVGGVLLDVEAMTALRPDGHIGMSKKGPPDCSRYCAPGPVDFWTKLLFHALNQLL